MTRLRPTLSMLALVLLEVGAVRALHALGGVRALALPAPADARIWLATVPPEDALAAVLRVVALGCAWWLLGTTLLYVAARLSGLPGAVAAVRWATLPGVRRLADRAVAVVVATAAAMGGGGTALAQHVPPLPIAGAPADGPALHDVLVPPGGSTPLAAPWRSAPVTPVDSPATATRPPPAALPPAVLSPAVVSPTASSPGGAPAAGALQTVAAPPVLPPALASPAAVPTPAAALARQGAADAADAGGRPTQRRMVSTGDVGPGLLGPGSMGAGAFTHPGTPAPTPGTSGSHASPAVPDVPQAATATPAEGTAHPRGEAAREHHVAAGEHLWGIAGAVLAAERAEPVDALPAREVHAYWIRLIEANRDRLESGDPDVVGVGEVLVLPVTSP